MKKIVIIANGEAPDEKLLRLIINGASYIIAADGGINICLANNITPDCLIGDLDSHNSIPQQMSHIKTLQIPDQNTTDLQKALTHAATLNPDLIEVCAAFGKRSDHGLGNLLILHSFAANSKLIMHDSFGTFTLLKPGEEYFKNKKGQTVSIFSLFAVSGIQLNGFEFPIIEEELQSPFLGVSNKIIEVVASIKFEQGKLLVYELNKDET